MKNTLKCYICYDEQNPDNVSLKNKIICPLKHFICDDCFVQLVENQLTDENYSNFKKYGSRITCNYDTCHFKFSRKIIEPKLKKLNRPDLWLRFNKQLDAVTKENYKNNPIIKFFSETSHFWENIVNSKIEFDVNFHKNKIIEDILNNKCPNCKTVFYDFTHCFAIKCSNCGCHFCGWCLKGFTDSHKCHAHVIKCDYSLEKGNLFSSTLNFKLVRNNIIAKNLTNYLNKLNFYDAIEVYSELSDNFKKLHLYNQPVEENKFNIISDKTKLANEHYQTNKINTTNNLLNMINEDRKILMLVLIIFIGFIVLISKLCYDIIIFVSYISIILTENFQKNFAI